jgi:hypothetical protein
MPFTFHANVITELIKIHINYRSNNVQVMSYVLVGAPRSDTQHTTVLVCVQRRRLIVTDITTFLQNSQKLPRVYPRARKNS